MLKKLVVGLLTSLSLAVGGIALTAAPAHADLADTASMSSSEYKKIKKGMSYKKVKKIVGGKGECSSFGKTRRCEWRYRGDVGFAGVDFSRKTGKVKYKFWLGRH